MKANLLAYYNQHPFRSILAVGLFVRVIAAIFSRGFGFSDDHFMVIEVAQQWLDGRDENNWLPWNGNTIANGPSLLYPGFHYYLFLMLKSIGITNPEFKMLIVRLMHAVYNLAIVYFGYRITKKLSGQEIAARVGWILALLWLLPMMSVRNAVEIVCIPPLMWATWLLLNADEKNNNLGFLVAGLIAGIAFSIRFQTLIFIGGMGLGIWMHKKWLQGIFFGVGALFTIVLIQNSIDLAIWGKPFVELQAYVDYNIANAYNYINGPWYNYILLIGGILIPPVSIFLIVGMFKVWKPYLWIILPALCFLIFHSYFPNKQERFILPVVPFFIMAGVAGWHRIEQSTQWGLKNARFINGSWAFFWILNTLLLVVLTPSSSKIARVDVMSYLRTKPDNQPYLLESSNSWDPIITPLFYMDNFEDHYNVCGRIPADSVFARIKSNNLPMPHYIVFAEEKNLDVRLEKIKQYVPNITFDKFIESSYLDKTMSWLNPVNSNLTYVVYKVNQE
jgi:hypothetical protein